MRKDNKDKNRDLAGNAPQKARKKFAIGNPFFRFPLAICLLMALGSISIQRAASASPQDVESSPSVPVIPVISPAEVVPDSAQNPPADESEAPALDPELGTLRLEEIEKPPAPGEANAYLLGWTGYSRSSNAFAEVDPVDDGMFRANLTFLALKEVTPTTTIFGAFGGSTNRYQSQSQYDYAGLTLNAGVSQALFERTTAEVGWINQQLFARNGSGRFLKDHSLYLQLRRQDPIAERVNLDTSYLLRFSFAEPDSRSQTLHSVRAALTYSPYTALQVGLEYQFAFSNFSQIERRDRYHELLASLTYQLTPRSRIELFGGRSFGGSSDPNIDFNNYIFGIGLGFTLF